MNDSSPESRIYLSPPHLGDEERAMVQEAFDTNWIAPIGPHVSAFEEEFAYQVGAGHAVALSSGTASLHLALRLVGIQAGDEVLISTLTFVASVNPVLYEGGSPVFVDSERDSWNMDPELLSSVIRSRARAGLTPKAVVLVHLYGQCADIDPIRSACDAHGVILIEDAAEALGSTYKGCSAGVCGRFGIFSFNGNKILTTSAGGMLVSDDGAAIARARKLASQARDAAPHYEHSEIGFNYRMSNVLAGIGRAQLRRLDDRVVARRRNFEWYSNELADVPGIRFAPEATWGLHTRWLTCLVVDSAEYGTTSTEICEEMGRRNIEARPIWKPMHMQPVFAKYPAIGGTVAEELFANGLCLPSGSNLTQEERQRVASVIQDLGCGSRS